MLPKSSIGNATRSAIIVLCIVLSVFLVVPGIARIITMHLQDSSLLSTGLFHAFFHGMVQDVTIAFELIAIYVLVTYQRPRLLLPVGVVILVIATIPIVFDVAMQCDGFSRLSIVQIRDFVRSFTAMFSSIFVRLIKLHSMAFLLVWAFAIAKATIVLTKHVQALPIVRMTLVLLCGAFFVFFQFSLFTGSATDAYIYGNALYTIQFGSLQMPITTKYNAELIVGDSGNVDADVLASGEMFVNLDPEFPLWRETTGYKTEKLFHLTTNSDRRPNIIMMNMESWGSLVTGTASNPDLVSLTPQFDRIIQKGIQYKSHFNPGLQTTNTLLSELLGVKPRFTHDPSMSEQAASLQGRSVANMLHDHQYDTTFLSSVDLHWHNWHIFLERHFDHVYGESDMDALLKDAGRECTSGCRGGWGYHDEWSLAALEHLIDKKTTERPDEPYFIDYYSISTHDPYNAPISKEDEREIEPRLERAYSDNDREFMKTLKYADTQLGRFIDRLEKRDLLHNTIIIISGDHGPLHRAEQFHSWGVVGDGEALDPYSHVPFAIIPSVDLLPQEYQGMKVDQVTSHVDIMTTLADFMQLFPLRHHSLGHSMQRKRQVDDRYVIVDQPQPGHVSVSVITDSVKYEFKKGECWAHPRAQSKVTGPAVRCRRNAAGPAQDADRWAKRVSGISHHAYSMAAFMPTADEQLK